ncbi:hypothetical protein OAR19_00710, partial [bacterium]|nr:hypothetical protein [bacterium]
MYLARKIKEFPHNIDYNDQGDPIDLQNRADDEIFTLQSTLAIVLSNWEEITSNLTTISDKLSYLRKQTPQSSFLNDKQAKFAELSSYYKKKVEAHLKKLDDRWQERIERITILTNEEIYDNRQTNDHRTNIKRSQEIIAAFHLLTKLRKNFTFKNHLTRVIHGINYLGPQLKILLISIKDEITRIRKEEKERQQL